MPLDSKGKPILYKVWKNTGESNKKYFVYVKSNTKRGYKKIGFGDKRYKDFRQHLIRHGDLVDVLDLENPKEELQKFRLISTFGSNGAGAISTSFNMTHDSGILTKVYSDLVHQKGILLSIRVQLMKLSNQKLRKKLLDDLENESWE